MWLVITGWLASALVFSAFFMKRMLPLRVLAVMSNFAFISYALLGGLEYGAFARFFPILVLHSALLPLNLGRLGELRGQRIHLLPATPPPPPPPLAGGYLLNVGSGRWERS